MTERTGLEHGISDPPGHCGSVTALFPLSSAMSPQLRSLAPQTGREAWGCPPGTVMLGPLDKTLLECRCILCLGTALTGNRVSFLVPVARPPLVLPACSALLLVTSVTHKAPLPSVYPFHGFPARLCPLFWGWFPPPWTTFPITPTASFPRTLSEYISHQPHQMATSRLTILVWP